MHGVCLNSVIVLVVQYTVLVFNAGQPSYHYPETGNLFCHVLTPVHLVAVVKKL